MTDEELRMWAIEKADGDAAKAAALMAFVRAPAVVKQTTRAQFTASHIAFIATVASETVRVLDVTKRLNAKFGTDFTAMQVRNLMIRKRMPFPRGSAAQIAQLADLRARRAARKDAA